MLFVVILLTMVVTGTDGVTRINRHFNGDIFIQQGCGHDLCASVPSSAGVRGGEEGCQCQCPSLRSTYREDTRMCVNDIQSCSLADFVSGNSSEKIPFVFLPLAGQLIYPSAEISIPGSGSVASPVCVVSTLNIMTEGGWRDLNNITHQFQQPFQLFREGDRTLLQWMGGSSLQQVLEGRLVLVNLLCKDLARKENSLYSPCISFRVAGSPGKVRKPEAAAGGENLTEREYLAIGICSGFLVMLYLFAMVVFLLIRRRHRRDKRLREQFLNLPLPQGLGYKSSRILGVGDSSLNPYFGNTVRVSTRSAGRCSVHSKDQDHIYDITKKSGSGSGSESEASVVLEMNEKLLEAHKKVVQNKLNREVARTIFDSPESVDSAEAVSSPRLNPGPPKSTGSHGRRFAPHLEGIPEESRANTLNAKSAGSQAARTTNDANSGEAAGEINEEGATSGNAQSQMKKLSTSDPQSLDSGILTRPSSISDLSDSQTDVVTSNDFDTDNETVDVADSDDTDDTDSDTYIEGSSVQYSPTKPQHTNTRPETRHKKDFVSEIYNTAVSKVPKVIPSDTESLYSTNSTMRKDFEYDSLDINSNHRLRDIYTNPNLSSRTRTQPRTEYKDDKDDYELVNVKGKEGRKNVAEVYVNNEYDASTLGSEEEEEEEDEDSDQAFEYSAGEKMMISISGDNESVYSNKLLISVNSNQAPSKFFSNDLNFDPDTLERATSRHLQSTVSGAGAPTSPSNTNSNTSSFYLFRDHTSSAGSSLPPYSTPAPRKPTLPPKTRSTPRLPPKPTHGQTPRISQRPLPPPPPPPPK